jgi:hypothetical protein
MQPNCQIPTLGMQLFYQKQLMQPNMQLFPTTFLSTNKNPHPRYAAFLSKTAHAAQLPNPHPRYAAFLSKTAHAAQHAAISNDFSINSMQPNKNPHPRYAAFLSKTAHAAQLPNPHPRYAAFLSKTAHAAQKMKKMAKMEKKSPSTSQQQPNIHTNNHHPTSPQPPHLTTTTTTYHLLILTPPTHTSYQAPTHTHPAPTHSTSSLSFTRHYSSHSNQALLIVLPGC